jgi:hypothetical protein
MKSPINLQAYRLILYKRALHPELFKVKGRRTIAHNGYEFEAWIMPGSHLMRFQYGDECAVELITDMEDGIPDRGILTALPCAGERDHDHAFGNRIKYCTTVHTEQLPESLYRATYQELTKYGQDSKGMIHTWTDEDGGKCASILVVERIRKEINAEAYHLMAGGGVVLRSQTLFEAQG